MQGSISIAAIVVTLTFFVLSGSSLLPALSWALPLWHSQWEEEDRSHITKCSGHPPSLRPRGGKSGLSDPTGLTDHPFPCFPSLFQTPQPACIFPMSQLQAAQS